MSRPVTRDALIVASDSQVSCEVRGEAVILGLDRGIYYGLNPVGARIWELVQRPRTLEEITHAIVEEFEVEPERAGTDAHRLLQELQALNLVTVLDESPR